MLHIERYNELKKTEWNEFVRSSRIPHFMFDRGYMDYHNDRFFDHSLIIRDSKKNIQAILPANENKNTLYSHQGLTFGGILAAKDARSTDMIEFFDIILNYCSSEKIQSFVYKRGPDIFSVRPNFDDLYGLHRKSAELISCDLTLAVDLNCPLNIHKGRKEGIKKAQKIDLKVEQTLDFKNFWTMLGSSLMKRHGEYPTHNLHEISLLAKKFPDNIQCHVVKFDGQIVAGTVVYITQNVVHTQYISSNDFGRRNGAVDLIMTELINSFSGNKGYFNFGTSTKKHSKHLNYGLFKQKQGFGASGFFQNTYQIDLNMKA